jgi:pyruvate kinase
VCCTVLVGDRVTSRKGVNLPGTSLRVPSFTEADREHLALGLEEGVDLVALSFVRHEEDLEPVLEMLGGATSRPLLLAKIEKPEAVDRLTPILERVDGVMVARGDLGVEMPVERVPLVQKLIIREARRAGRPVITATQMLRSMVSSPRPLRAEATDVANAILDGTDAVMLSEETAVGAYPERAVEVLDRLARAVEPEYDTRDLLDEPLSGLLASTPAAVSRAACSLAAEVDAAAIVAATTSGSTARMVARFRPPRPVVAVTTVAAVARQLTLSWGVLPTRVEVADDPDSVLASSVAAATGLGVAGPGDLLVTTAGLPLNVTGTTNVLRVVEVEGSET